MCLDNLCRSGNCRCAKVLVSSSGFRPPPRGWGFHPQRANVPFALPPRVFSKEQTIRIALSEILPRGAQHPSRLCAFGAQRREIKPAAQAALSENRAQTRATGRGMVLCRKAAFRAAPDAAPKTGNDCAAGFPVNAAASLVATEAIYACSAGPVSVSLAERKAVAMPSSVAIGLRAAKTRRHSARMKG
jgi:hypothetical protein